MPNIPIVLVGNQIDMRSDPVCLKRLAKQKEKPITTEEGEKLVREVNATAHIQCSCLDQRGVKKVFEKSIKISQNMTVEYYDETSSLHILVITMK